MCLKNDTFFKNTQKIVTHYDAKNLTAIIMSGGVEGSMTSSVNITYDINVTYQHFSCYLGNSYYTPPSIFILKDGNISSKGETTYGDTILFL